MDGQDRRRTGIGRLRHGEAEVVHRGEQRLLAGGHLLGLAHLPAREIGARVVQRLIGVMEGLHPVLFWLSLAAHRAIQAVRIIWRSRGPRSARTETGEIAAIALNGRASGHHAPPAFSTRMVPRIGAGRRRSRR
ncbi:hypothetical protein [Methylobacterium gregans]|uniref:hypothetical protein n=1 Tax=Methylobacterium gregans TaxID=374424 RepID=UPI00361899B1